MRAVKGKNGVLSFTSNPETALFNKIELHGFMDISSLSEREHYLAEELFKRNLLKKIKRGDKIGYKIYEQKTAI